MFVSFSIRSCRLIAGYNSDPSVKMSVFVFLQVNIMYEGKTALHVAIEEGCPSAVKLLVEYKANMDLQVC